MNIRKNIDYSEMYKALDDLMAKELTQMELYCEIGKAVCVNANIKVSHLAVKRS